MLFHFNLRRDVELLFTHGTFISGKVASKKEVTEIMQQFNIQVNNLTQVSSRTCN
jgi:hypothetical protein